MDENTFTECKQCGGDGEIDCIQCYGTGRNGDEVCSYCKGEKVQKCPVCNGTGKV